MAETYLIIELLDEAKEPHVVVTLGSVPALRGALEWTPELIERADKAAKALMAGVLLRKELETFPVKLHYTRMIDAPTGVVVIR